MYEIIYHFIVRSTNTEPDYVGEDIENNECGISAFISATCSFVNEKSDKVSKKVEKLPCIFQLMMNGIIFMIQCLFWLLFFIASPIWIFIFIMFNAFYFVLAWCTNTKPDYSGMEEKEVEHRIEEKNVAIPVKDDIKQPLLENEN